MSNALADARTMAVIFLVNRFSLDCPSILVCSPTRVNNQSNRSRGAHNRNIKHGRLPVWSDSLFLSFSVSPSHFSGECTCVRSSLFLLASTELKYLIANDANPVAIKITRMPGLKLLAHQVYEEWSSDYSEVILLCATCFLHVAFTNAK